jgi:hypothetical protein
LKEKHCYKGKGKYLADKKSTYKHKIYVINVFFNKLRLVNDILKLEMNEIHVIVIKFFKND